MQKSSNLILILVLVLAAAARSAAEGVPSDETGIFGRLQASADLSEYETDDLEEAWSRSDRAFTGGEFKDKGAVDAGPSRWDTFKESVGKGAKLGWTPGSKAAEWYAENVINPVASPAPDATRNEKKPGVIKRAAAGTARFFYTLVNLPVMLVSYNTAGAMGILGGIGGGIVGGFKALFGKPRS